MKINYHQMNIVSSVCTYSTVIACSNRHYDEAM